MKQNTIHADSHISTGPRDHHWVPCTPVWDVDEAYKLYLHGASLRKLAGIYGMKFYTIYRLLLKARGPLACQVQNVSLVRSVLRDQRVSLEALEGYERYLGGDQTHRPQRTMNNLSKFKTIFDPADTEAQAYQGPSPWDYAEAIEAQEQPGYREAQTWRLPLYTTVVCAICAALESMATAYPVELGPMALPGT